MTSKSNFVLASARAMFLWANYNRNNLRVLYEDLQALSAFPAVSLYKHLGNGLCVGNKNSGCFNVT